MLTNKICARHITTLSQTDLPLPIPICCPWTSLSNTVFTQIVSSYNYERLIRSISTPFCLPNMYALFVLLFLRPFTYTPLLLTPSIRTPLFYPSLLIRSIRTYIRTPLLLLPLFLLPITHPSICTHNMYAFFPKNFSQKNRYAQSVPKNFPKIFTYYNTSPALLSENK